MAAETATNYHQLTKGNEHCRRNTEKGETVMTIGTKDQNFSDPWQHVATFKKKDGKSVMSTLMTGATRGPRRQLSEKYQVRNVERHIENSYYGWQERCNNRWKETQSMNGNKRNPGGGEDGNLEREPSGRTNTNTSLEQGENISWLTDPIPKPPWPPPKLGRRWQSLRAAVLLMTGGEDLGEKWIGTGTNDNIDHHRGVAEIYDNIHLRCLNLCGSKAQGTGRSGNNLRCCSPLANTEQVQRKSTQRVKFTAISCPTFSLTLGNYGMQLSHSKTSVGSTRASTILSYRKGIGVREIALPPDRDHKRTTDGRFERTGIGEHHVSEPARWQATSSSAGWIQQTSSTNSTMMATAIKKRVLDNGDDMEIDEPQGEGGNLSKAAKENTAEKVPEGNDAAAGPGTVGTPIARPDLFTATTSALKKKSKSKTSGKQSGKKLSFSQATELGKKKVTEFIPTKHRTVEVTIQRTRNNSLLVDITDALTKTLTAVKDAFGQNKAALLPVRGGTGPLTKTPIQRGDAFTVAQKYMDSHVIDFQGDKSVKEIETILHLLHHKKKGGKVEQFKFVVIIGHLDVDVMVWGEVFDKLSLDDITLKLKTHPAVRSKEDILLFQATTKAAPEYLTKMVNKTLTTALEEIARDTPVEELEDIYPDPPVLLISVGFPPDLWDNSKSYLKDIKSKMVVKVEYDVNDEKRIHAAFKKWRVGLRKVLGVHAYPYIAPAMNDANTAESKKNDYRGRASMSAAYKDSQLHISLRGFLPAPHGLDAEISVETEDGDGITTTARSILMMSELPRIHRTKKRPVFLALLELKGGGVDAVIPNGEEFRMFVKNVAVCPAAWFLYHMALEMDATSESMMEAVKKIFTPDDLQVARNCVSFDPDDGSLQLTFDQDDSTLPNNEQNEVMQLDWMQEALDVSAQLHGSNARENGQLFNFDEESDVGSTTTEAFLTKRYGRTFQEVLDERATSRVAKASQAEVADALAPPRNSVVGQGE